MKQIFTLLLLAFTATASAADDKNTVPSTLQTATVFATGAELTHGAKASLKQGNNELIIQGISSAVDINSIQVKCPAAVTILGIEFSNNYLQPETENASAKRLQDSINRISEVMEQLDVSITTTSELLSVLRSNKEIKGTQTGLSVAELIKLMDYYKQKSNELQNELATLQNKKKKWVAVQQKLQNQLAEERKKNILPGGRLILQLSAAMPGRYDFTLSYITQNAYWIPYYDIKADNIKSPLNIIYKARIVQTTGIDWQQVKLSLSTSAPTQYGNAPLFRTWFLSYIDPVNVMQQRLSTGNTIPSINNNLAGKVGGVQTTTLSEVVTVSTPIRIRGNNNYYSDKPKPIYVVNGTIMTADDANKINSNYIEDMTVLQGDEAKALYGAQATNGAVVMTLKDGMEDFVSVTSNELDVTYDIALPYDVPTNGKPQIATLKEEKIEAVYKYYAAPKLDKDAYLLAEVSDWGKLNLIPGEANIIFEGTYIGKTFIDPANTNDTLNLTVGKDKRVVVKREKAADFSSVKFLGSNKLQKITYDLTVKNTKQEPIKLLLKEQYPISTNKEVEVSLLESSEAMVNEETGVLTWKVELAPGETKKVRVAYSVKYPKGKTLNLQ